MGVMSMPQVRRSTPRVALHHGLCEAAQVRPISAPFVRQHESHGHATSSRREPLAGLHHGLMEHTKQRARRADATLMRPLWSSPKMVSSRDASCLTMGLMRRQTQAKTRAGAASGQAPPAPHGRNCRGRQGQRPKMVTTPCSSCLTMDAMRTQAQAEMRARELGRRGSTSPHAQRPRPPPATGSASPR